MLRNPALGRGGTGGGAVEAIQTCRLVWPEYKLMQDSPLVRQRKVSFYYRAVVEREQASRRTRGQSR